MVWDEAATPIVVAAEPLALGSGLAGAPRVATNGKSSGAASETVGVPGTAGLTLPRRGEDPGGSVGDASRRSAPSNGVAPSKSAAPTGPAERELRQMYADLNSQVQRLSGTVDRLTAGAERSERDAVLREVDARFAWLTKELSDRLVILGNEIMAIKRHLQAGSG